MLTSLNKPHGSGSISFLTKLFFFFLSFFAFKFYFFWCSMIYFLSGTLQKKQKKKKKPTEEKEIFQRHATQGLTLSYPCVLWFVRLFFFFVRLFLAVKSRCHVHIWWWILRQIDGYISGWIESRSHRNLYFTLFSLSFSLSLIACHISQSFVPIARPRLSDSACHGNFTE